MYRSQYFEGGRVLTAAISAINMALHDAVARSLGIPVFMLLGVSSRAACDRRAHTLTFLREIACAGRGRSVRRFPALVPHLRTTVALG